MLISYRLKRNSFLKSDVASSSLSLTDIPNPLRFISQMEDISERKQAQEALEKALAEAKRLVEEQTILAEISQNLAAKQSVQEVLEAAYEGASRLIDTSNFSVGLYNAANQEVSFAFSLNESKTDRQITNLPVSQGITGYIIRNATAVLFAENVSGGLSKLGIAAEYLQQSKLYRQGVYDKEIKHALEHIKEIKGVLNKYRKEDL